jgi:glycosyltransferase involved in cell wall biosynthesis
VKFLFVSSVFHPASEYGGIPHRVYGLAAALISLGHSSQVVTTNAGGARNLQVKLEELTTYGKVPVIYTERWSHNSYFYAPRLLMHLRKLAPSCDMAVVSGGWSYLNLAVRRSLPRLDVPYVINPEGQFDPWAFRHKYLKKVLYWRLVEKYNYSRAAGIIALTDNEAGQVKQFVRGVPVQVIPNGVNLDDFQSPTGQEEWEKTFPELAHSPYILFLSRLHPKKGLDLLLPAFQRLLEQCREPQVLEPYLVVAGNGATGYEREIKALAHGLGIAHRVLFPGLITGTAKQALLQHCCFTVLPSRGEGLPIAVLESMACSKPVVITPACYLPEVARAGAGFEVELGVEQLAQAMLQLWNSPGMREEMGKQAVALVKEKFTWEKVAEQTVRFSEHLLAQRRRT